MSQIGRRREGFRMEGRDVNNDMAEIKRMLKQLEVRIDRIEARRRGRKSSDGERNVTTYHQRVDRIETFYQEGDSSDGEIYVDPFHLRASLCESEKRGEPCSFDYGGLSSIFTFSVHENIEKQKKDGVEHFEKPPKYDSYEEVVDSSESPICDSCCEICLEVESNIDEQDNKDIMAMQDVEVATQTIYIKDTIKSILWQDMEHQFIDFVGVNRFIMPNSKDVVYLRERQFGFVKVTLVRKYMESRSDIYSKYLFIWKGRIQVAIGMSKQDLHQWRILWGILSIKGTNSRTNSFQPGEFDAGAYMAISKILFVFNNRL